MGVTPFAGEQAYGLAKRLSVTPKNEFVVCWITPFEYSLYSPDGVVKPVSGRNIARRRDGRRGVKR